MNLVLSGPIDDSLRNLVVSLTRPRRVVRLHARADRLEGAIDDEAVRTQIADLCDAARVDHAYIEEGLTFADFKLLAMDMDSTLITIECIDELADYAGKKAEVAAITEAAMRGEIDFEESLRRRVSTLAGSNTSILKQVFDERLVLTPGARVLVNTAKGQGLTTLVLSGGFTYFTTRLASELSLDGAYANVLQCSGNLLTGKIVGPVFDAAAKATTLRKYMLDNFYSANEVLVIGDGANDIPMMNLIKYSVSYKGKPKVQLHALYKINFGGLDTLVDYLAVTHGSQ